MNEEIWKKIGRIKDFDSVRSGFLGYCRICKETLHKGKEIIIKNEPANEIKGPRLFILKIKHYRH